MQAEHYHKVLENVMREYASEHLKPGFTTVFIWPTETLLRESCERARDGVTEPYENVQVYSIESSDENGICDCWHNFNACSLVALGVKKINDPLLCDIIVHRVALIQDNVAKEE
jgi:hypothetical protein